MAKSENLKYLPVALIRENQVALREVNKGCEEYVGLVDSIKQVGVLLPITVREVRDPDSGQKYYSLIDGLHRYNAAQDAGLEEVPCHVLTMDELQVLEAQLMANVHKVETRPVEYSKQLARILAHNPLMTAAELSVKLGKSPTWVGARLNLTKLDEKIQALVDDGTINLTNAIAMSKLPVEEQGSFVERAITMTPAEFTPTVNARIKEVRDAKRQGRDPSAGEFTPVEHLRKLAEIRGEFAHPEVGPVSIKEQGLRKPDEIWRAALAWVLQVDPASVEVARQKHDARKKEEAEGRAARKAERDEIKAELAARAQAKATAGA